MRRLDMEVERVGYSEIETSHELSHSPLSFQQERVFYLHKLSAGGPLWNRVSCKRLVGRINAKVLKESVESLIERHSTLRTRIGAFEGELRQVRSEALDGAFECVDLSDQPVSGIEEQARAILNREYEQPLSVEGGQLFHAVLVRCGNTEWWLILKLHHIISDATTLRILWNDLKVLYNSRLGSVECLPRLELDYMDYTIWLRENFKENDTEEQESYWLRQFAGELPRLELPTDYPEPTNITFSGASVKRRVPQALIKRLQSFSFEKRVIPFSTMLSANYLLLRCYCRQDDIVVGTVFSGRHYSQKLKRLAGFFSNTVALRARLDDEYTVEEFVRLTHKQVTDAHEMQDYPFERLVDRLDLDREHERNPLFRAMFNMVTGHAERVAFEGVDREEWLEPEIRATQVDFFLDFHMSSDESELRVEYNTDIFSRQTIDRMLRHYVAVVEKIMDAPGGKIGELRMLDAAEERLILSLGEGEVQPRRERGVVELLEERASRTPEQVAVLSSDGVINCADFNRRTNQLAATLVESGVAENDVVAIMLDRSLEMVLGVFAILKVGAAYLPIDPGCPRQRVEHMLRDSGVCFVLVGSDVARDLAATNDSLATKCISVDHQDSYIGDGGNTGRKASGSSSAYVIYTSGSTGRPKGVVVEHRALMNTLEFLEASFPLAGKTILLKTNFTFDVAASELFGWLLGDGRLALLDRGAEKDPRKLIQAIDEYGVTHINFVPSLLDAFLAGVRRRDVTILERLEYVFVAGETLPPELVNDFQRLVRGVRLENLYGPTEAAIYATCYSSPARQDLKRVPIGRPIPNTRSYLLDENLKLLPVGVTGELCLAGAGLARGYLNEPELTDKKFCANPYRAGERIYRTGDLARWGDDGLLRFVGRTDGQVKVRGFRIELGEIERRLLACRCVAEAVVTARPDRFGQQGLVAYFVRKERPVGSLEEIREEMAAWLPGYMMPELFVELERLPRLPSGKVDLQALPEPDRRGKLATKGPVNASPLERKVIEIAERLLNTTGLDPDSNFFRLGGNSLLTLRFIAALDDELGTRLSAMDFLGLPTISQIAELIESSLSCPNKPAEVAVPGPQGACGALRSASTSREGESA